MLDAVPGFFHSGSTGAMRAAKEPTISLNAVTDDPAAAVSAPGSELVNRTLEAVESVDYPIGHRNQEGFVVVVAA